MTEKKEQTTASLLVSFVLMLAISGYIINMAISSDNFRVDYELYQHGKIAPGKVKSVVRSFETPRNGKSNKPYEVYDHIIAFEGKEQDFRLMRPLAVDQELDIYYSSRNRAFARVKEPSHPFISIEAVLLQPNTLIFVGIGLFGILSAFFILVQGIFSKIKASRAKENETV
ncbi:MAG: hypothetical protein ACAH80_10575 [Alphaproteobacteria bacterium]